MLILEKRSFWYTILYIRTQQKQGEIFSRGSAENKKGKRGEGHKAQRERGEKNEGQFSVEPGSIMLVDHQRIECVWIVVVVSLKGMVLVSCLGEKRESSFDVCPVDAPRKLLLPAVA